jgi:hypothetical protein
MELCIVSSHYKEDLTWLKNSKFPVYVISKNKNKLDDFFTTHYIKNRGSEFGSYLWFICKYWDNLPNKVAFIHGHEKSTHQSISIFDAINKFKKFDFHGLNGPRTIGYHYFFDDIVHPWFPNGLRHWEAIGLNELCLMPRQFVFEGATQTIISKKLIKSKPLNFYKNILNHIMSLSFEEAYNISVFLEMAWHVIFNQNPINFEIYNPFFNNYCLKNKISILLMGPGSVWHSSMQSQLCFEYKKLQEDWKKKCYEGLYV